jgi:hypothetical protein
MLHSGEER